MYCNQPSVLCHSLLCDFLLPNLGNYLVTMRKMWFQECRNSPNSTSTTGAKRKSSVSWTCNFLAWRYWEATTVARRHHLNFRLHLPFGNLFQIWQLKRKIRQPTLSYAGSQINRMKILSTISMLHRTKVISILIYISNEILHTLRRGCQRELVYV